VIVPHFEAFMIMLLACRSDVTGAQWVLQNKAHIAFNPPGDIITLLRRAGGFCYVIDVVLGCETLAKAGKRVVFAILMYIIARCSGGFLTDPT
jgi:acetoin utilization deacetylase AcuC-like enzyme